jgi:transposase
MSRFRPIDRASEYLLPPSVQDWLPESHLARYVVDVVEGLDLSELERDYAGRGSEAYHPAMLLSLLI